MKRLLAILAITISHATLTWILFLCSFGKGMSRFDTGNSISIGERILSGLVEVLMWPVLAPLTSWGGNWVNQVFPGLLGYVPLVINSIVWALVIVWFWGKIQQKRKTSNK